MQPLRLLALLASTSPFRNAGWNMVVLLRCRLQHSLFRPILPSLHRPPDALGSNPPHAGTAFGLMCFTNSYFHPPLGGFHIAKAIFHCASAQFHPASAGFHCGRKPALTPSASPYPVYRTPSARGRVRLLFYPRRPRRRFLCSAASAVRAGTF